MRKCLHSLRAAAAPLVSGAIAASVAAAAVTVASTAGDGPAGRLVARMAGQAIFEADWVAAPDVSDGADGLGPLYNASRCAACHADATGHEASSPAPRVVRLARAASGEPALAPDPVYGRQIQDKATGGIAAEAQVRLAWREVNMDVGAGRVSLREPIITLVDLAYGPLADGLVLSLRQAPALSGVGLLAAIDGGEIAAGADPADRDGDGISGRVAASLSSESAGDVGRFGWQASSATLQRQTSDAFQLDMGLSTPEHPGGAGECTATQAACLEARDGGSIAKGGREVGEAEVALLVAFLESLAPPARTPDQNSPGARVFDGLGCAACHRPEWVTGTADGRQHLGGQRIAPFTDLLLHDLGAGLAAGPAAVEAAREWRTAPLWGLAGRLRDIAAGRREGLLHDGRARTLEEAVLWHAGEASGARTRYLAAPADERAALIAFLGGL